jgi:hypothetical protein
LHIVGKHSSANCVPSLWCLFWTLGKNIVSWNLLILIGENVWASKDCIFVPVFWICFALFIYLLI